MTPRTLIQAIASADRRATMKYAYLVTFTRADVPMMYPILTTFRSARRAARMSAGVIYRMPGYAYREAYRTRAGEFGGWDAPTFRMCAEVVL